MEIVFKTQHGQLPLNDKTFVHNSPAAVSDWKSIGPFFGEKKFILEFKQYFEIAISKSYLDNDGPLPFPCLVITTNQNETEKEEFPMYKGDCCQLIFPSNTNVLVKRLLHDVWDLLSFGESMKNNFSADQSAVAEHEKLFWTGW